MAVPKLLHRTNIYHMLCINKHHGTTYGASHCFYDGKIFPFATIKDMAILPPLQYLTNPFHRIKK